MATLAARSRVSLDSRRLYSAGVGWGAVSVTQQRRPFSCSSHFTNNPHGRSRLDRLKLPDTPCRTRFAPSPTGYLHLGSLRTTLFNYLLARATGGQFVLRIEDTDQSRLVPDAEERLYQDLKWAGLSWDEGPDVQGPYGPYRQSERLPLYSEHADRLVREGKAYRCFCSPEDLEEHKRVAHERGEPTIYPGTCRNIPLGESDSRAARGEQFAVRFKSAEKPTMIEDLVYTRYRKKDPEEDFIIMKRDGFPTYHFANVVDDRHMKITHVIRGAEWLISTPKHVELYNALGWEPPKFAHVGLLVDAKRQKLSKRDDSANLAWYKDNLILPSALLNFTALLGWRGRGPQGEVMTLQEMVDNFSLQFTKGDIMVSLQKLPHFQSMHLGQLERDGRLTDPARFRSHVVQPVAGIVDEIESARKQGTTAYPMIPHTCLGEWRPDARILEERFSKYLLRELAHSATPPTEPKLRYELALARLKYHFWEVPQAVLRTSLQELQLHPTATIMPFLLSRISTVDENSWTTETLSETIKQIRDDARLADHCAEEHQATAGNYLHSLLRWALFASKSGPPSAESMHVLGREETLRRLDAARLVIERMATRQEGDAATPPAEQDGERE
ncbi:hypothetical protein VTK26DRAFT_5746 [Humicola hyalothermophila]